MTSTLRTILQSATGRTAGGKGPLPLRPAVYLFLGAMLWGGGTAVSGWKTVPVGRFTNLRGVSFPDRLHGWVVGDSGLILTTTDGGASWSEQNSGFTGTLRTVTFFDVDHGIAGGNNGALLSTANGGKHWRAAPAISSVVVFSSCMIDASTGWFAGVNGDFVSGLHGYTYRTTDGGQSWGSATAAVTTAPLFDVQFLDAQNGWCVGGYLPGYLDRSIDGGISWSGPYQNAYYQLTRLSFVDSLHGFLAGTHNGVDGAVLATADGGGSWTIHPTPGVGSATDIVFVDSLHGWLVAAGGTILRTTDGGGIWSPESSHTTQDLANITFRGDSIGWIAGMGGTLLTHEPDLPTGAAQEEPFLEFQLLQNYPNPFNPATTVRFTLTHEEKVSVKIFDPQGREVRALFEGVLNAGAHELSWDAQGSASGVYFCRLQAGAAVTTKKLLLTR